MQNIRNVLERDDLIDGTAVLVSTSAGLPDRTVAP